MTIVILLLVGMLLYFVGGLVWLKRERKLRNNFLHGPWREALGRRDFESCDYYNEAAKTYPLLEARVVLNPIAWIRYWNWRPPEFVSTKFPAGTYKRGDEFDIH